MREATYVFSRVGLVSSLAFAGLSAGGLLFAHQPAHTIAAAVDNKPFTISNAKGRYLALHYMQIPPSDESAAQVLEFTRRSSEVAGVVHAFVVRSGAADARDWATRCRSAESLVYYDADGQLANELMANRSPSSETTSPPARFTIVFDPDGKELLRIVPGSGEVFPSFDAFAAHYATKAALPAIGDYNLPESRLALEGYDPVAYFVQGKAERGKANLFSSYRGVTYRFASDQNRRAFIANPAGYLPTYGGWCASAMGAKAKKIEIDPTNFKIKDGRLLLFYKDFFSDALKDWNKHEKEWEPAADVNWKKLSGEAPLEPPK